MESANDQGNYPAAPLEGAIGIVCNGEQRQIASGLSVAALISSLGLHPDMVAVELEGRVLPRSDYEKSTLVAGNRLELIRFVGGG